MTNRLSIVDIFLFKAKDKKVFLAALIIIGLVFSLPFILSINDLWTYIQGTLLVHSNRFVQGRPFLFYISYFYKIEFFQIIPFKTYSLLASISGWLLVTILYLTNKLRDKYGLALMSFLAFYLFTPVFNRTYFLWFLPVFIISAYKLFENKHKWAFYLTLLVFFAFAGWYLVQWEDGFHVWRP